MEKYDLIIVGAGPAGIFTAVELLRRGSKKHILLVAGSGFDWPEPDHFRLVLLPEAQKLKKAIEDIGDFLSTYHQ